MSPSLTRFARALRPFALDGVEARIALRREAALRLQGQRPLGISAHALPLGPGEPVRERHTPIPAATSGRQAWPQRSVHALGDVLLDGRTGLVMVEGRVVHESGGIGVDKRPKAQEWFLEPYLNAVRGRGGRGVARIDGHVHHIGNIPRGNYYHWIVEVLPRILIARECYPDLVVLSPPVPRFASEALQLLGIDHRVFEGPVHVESLLLVDPPLLARPHPREVELLRDASSHALSRSGRAPELARVYVSRSRDTRSMFEEERLESWLRARGFTVFLTEHVPAWIDQLALFAGAEVLVGLHGAGLTNCIFLPDGAEVIELQPDALSNDMFGAICSVRGLRYTSRRVPVGPGAQRFGSADLAISLLEPLIEG